MGSVSDEKIDRLRRFMNTEARQRKRAANQEAGGKAEQGKNTEARQKKRATNQEAGDKAGQRKRAERAKTGIQPYSSTRGPFRTPLQNYS